MSTSAAALVIFSLPQSTLRSFLSPASRCPAAALSNKHSISFSVIIDYLHLHQEQRRSTMSNRDGNGDMPLLTVLSSLSLGWTSSWVSTPTATTPTSAAPTANSFEASTPTASATTTVFFTPTDNDEKEWEAFCSSINVWPPKHINKALCEVKKEANSILRGSCLLRPSDESSHYEWEDLEDLQKAGMAFIINEGILACFTGGEDMNRRITYGVLGIDRVDDRGKVTTHGKAIWRDLLQFVLKKGDLINSTGNWTTNIAAEKHQQFRSDHRDLWGEVGGRKVKSCTMFSLNPGINPVLRFQAEFSMGSAFVVSSLMIHYRQVIHPQGGAPASGAAASGTSTWSSIAEATPRNQGNKQTRRYLFPRRASSWRSSTLPWRRKARDSNTIESGPESPTHPPVAVLANDNAIETRAGTFTLNIGRYMRHNLTARQKYKAIFEGREFRFEEVMAGFLKLSNANAPEGGFLGFIYINQNETPKYFYNEVKEQLQHGALCARVRTFEGYEEKTNCFKEPGMVFTDSFHFVTIHGVSRTHHDQHHGIVFLVQDSFEVQPFKQISLELLREMGSTGVLSYIRHNMGIKMPNTSVFDIKPEDIVTAGELELQRSGCSRYTDGPISEEERKERKEKRELLEALVNPYYLPEWARRFESNNDATVVHADTVEGGHEGVFDVDTVDEGKHLAIKAVDAVVVEGEASIEVQYERSEGKELTGI